MLGKWSVKSVDSDISGVMFQRILEKTDVLCGEGEYKGCLFGKRAVYYRLLMAEA